MSAIAWSHLALACWYAADAERVQSERSWSSRPCTCPAEAWMSAEAVSSPPKFTLSCPASMSSSPRDRVEPRRGASAEPSGELAVGRGLLLVGRVVLLLGHLQVGLELVEGAGDPAGVLVPAGHQLLEGRRARADPLGPDPGQLAAQSAQLLVEVTVGRLHHLRTADQCLVLFTHLAGHRQPPSRVPRAEAARCYEPALEIWHQTRNKA